MTASRIILLLGALAFPGCATHNTASTEDPALGKSPTVILVPVMVMPSQGEPSDTDPQPLLGPIPPQQSGVESRPGNAPVNL